MLLTMDLLNIIHTQTSICTHTQKIVVAFIIMYIQIKRKDEIRFESISLKVQLMGASYVGTRQVDLTIILYIIHVTSLAFWYTMNAD